MRTASPFARLEFAVAQLINDAFNEVVKAATESGYLIDRPTATVEVTSYKSAPGAMDTAPVEVTLEVLVTYSRVSAFVEVGSRRGVIHEINTALIRVLHGVRPVPGECGALGFEQAVHVEELREVGTSAWALSFSAEMELPVSDEPIVPGNVREILVKYFVGEPEPGGELGEDLYEIGGDEDEDA